MRGGFIPRPRGALLGDFCVATHSKRSSQGSTRRYFPILFSQVGAEEPFSEEPLVSQPCDEPSDVMIRSSHLTRDNSGCVDGLSPGIDEADKGVSGVTRSMNTETKTSASRNPVAGGGKSGDVAPEATAATSSRRAYILHTHTHTHVHIPKHTHVPASHLHAPNRLSPIYMFQRVM